MASAAHRKESSAPPKRGVANTDISVDARAIVRSLVSECLTPEHRVATAQSVCARIVESYAINIERGDGESFSRTSSPVSLRLSPTANKLACQIGQQFARGADSTVAFQIGELYSLALPDTVRASRGVFYTPPPLSARLLDLAEQSGIDWRTARILDPACGGGAFLAPAAERIASSLSDCLPPLVLQNIVGRLRGLEIDSFAAWMSQVFLETTLRDVSRAAGRPLPQMITVCDSLEEPVAAEGFDLVIGNPPFGRTTLSAAQRDRYKRSLFGHANLYGLFLDLAIRWTKFRGLIAFVTPTSYLAGEYFKSLRSVLRDEAPPISIDIVTDRKGVFGDVLQETALSVFRRGAKLGRVNVRQLSPSGAERVSATELGTVRLPVDRTSPWLLPRSASDAQLLEAVSRKRSRLSDWGYGVSTGQLVWNRHKHQMRVRKESGVLPIVWAEAVTAEGEFMLRAEKRNHARWIAPTADDDWLLTTTPCVLLQRTTAKEQKRRLIATELPAETIRENGAVVVENHLNMVKPIRETPAIRAGTVAAVLNSDVLDQVFRCISGSVAVSAFELEALPLPTIKQMAKLECMIVAGATRAQVESELRRLYGLDSK